MQVGVLVPTFRRGVLHPSSGWSKTPLQMEVASFSEMLAPVHQCTRRHPRCENLKLQMEYLSLMCRKLEDAK
jgi:hypothetical protein